MRQSYTTTCRIFIVCLSVSTAFPETVRELESTLNALFSKPTSGVSWSVAIHDLTADNAAYDFHANDALIPASNQKLLTAAAALLRLGSNYRSKTDFFAAGLVRNGVLQGNLVVAGYGSIDLTARFPKTQTIAQQNDALNGQLDRLAERLRQHGIQVITGTLAVTWNEWSDMSRNAHYPSAAPVSFHENTIDVAIQNGKIAHCPSLLAGFQLTKTSWDGTQKKQVVNGVVTDTIVINPHKSSRDYWRLEQTSPLLYYQRQLIAGLTQRGIEFQGRATADGDAWEGKTFLFALESLPLSEILEDMGLYSDNFRAELVFLNLGYVVYGKANYANAAKAVTAILQEQGISLAGATVSDGSGLSRDNRVSAAQMVHLLNHVAATAQREAFVKIMPVAGRSGTLEKRFTSSDLRGRLVGKTGTLDGVTALSGYFLRDSRPAYSLSFLCNHRTGNDRAWRTMESAARAFIRHYEL